MLCVYMLASFRGHCGWQERSNMVRAFALSFYCPIVYVSLFLPPSPFSGGEIEERMTEESVPLVIVFDLDGTLWAPEMYELWGGGGAPFRADPSDPNGAFDRAGTNVRLLGETRELLQKLSTDPKWSSTSLAISSTCDEPRWAMELLQLFQFTDSSGRRVPMLSLFGDLVEIYSANKASHHRTILRKLREKEIDVKEDFSQFVFFDNQTNNVESVSSIGVTSVYCPRGMVSGVFERGIQQWREKVKRSVL
ncbi:putative magnesium-dependent phosphatase-1/HAD phosphatase, family IIIC, partial [Trypanosoma cruzi]